jgi:hypothetical protein
MRTKRDIEENVGRLPATLEKSYDAALSNIMACPRNEELLAKRAFAWIRCSYKPVLPSVWAEGCYSPDDPPANGVDTLLDLCRNLVVRNEQLGQVVFAHLSVKEYLEMVDPDSNTAHSMVSLSCLCRLTGQNELTIVRPPVLLHA